MLMCALRWGGLGNGTQSDQHAHGQHSTHCFAPPFVEANYVVFGP
jgi:hypothetical protein